MAIKRRKDCVFGMHFDFHATENDTNLGSDFKADEFEKMLEEVKPDVVQVDTKGHPGYASYPSKLGNYPPKMEGDMIAIMRALTKKHGVLMFSHYSGVWDVNYCNANPQDKAIFKDSVEWRGETSVFSPYAEKLLIPQLKELAEKGVDGVWIDGECWATQADYSESALNAYRAEYGKDPDLENDREGYEYFCRKGFYAYIKNYCGQVHKAYPDFEIGSNWLGTTFCPQYKGMGTDFITGDYDPYDSVNTARFQSKALVRHTMHKELLSWGFNIQNGFHVDKSATSMKQEVAAVYNHGVTVSLYYTCKRGNIKMYMLPVWKELSEYCKPLGKFTKDIEVLPEIAVLQSEKGFYRNKLRLFSTWDDKNAIDLQWLTLALCDAGFGTEVAFTEFMKENLQRYSLVVIPDFPAIESDLKADIVNYVKNGGKILVCGTNAAQLFAQDLGYTVSGATDDTFYAIFDEMRVGITGEKRKIGGISEFIPFYDEYINGNKKSAACYVGQFGKGSFAVLPFAVGRYYGENKSGYFLSMLKKIVYRLGFKPIALANKDNLDVVCAKKGTSFIINLLNLRGNHADRNVRHETDIPKISDVTLTVDYSAVKNIIGGDVKSVKDRFGSTYGYAVADGKVIINGVDVDIQQSIIIE